MNTEPLNRKPENGYENYIQDEIYRR